MYAEDTLKRPVCILGRDEGNADEGAAGTLRGQRGKPFCITRQTYVGSPMGATAVSHTAHRLFATYKLGDSSNL